MSTHINCTNCGHRIEAHLTLNAGEEGGYFQNFKAGDEVWCPKCNIHIVVRPTWEVALVSGQAEACVLVAADDEEKAIDAALARVKAKDVCWKGTPGYRVAIVGVKAHEEE